MALPNAVPFVIGGMAAGASAVTVAMLTFWALAFYSYSCKVNDLADFKTDLLNTTGRTQSPLLRGTLTPLRVGYWASIELLILAFTLGLSQLSLLCKAVGLGLLALTTYGNAFQKTSKRIPPLVMDYLFGLVMAAPIVAVAYGLGASVSWALWLLSISFMFQMVVLNSYSGNLKDLEHDYAVGARTTAIRLGVRRIGPSQWLYPWKYRLFLLSAQITSSTLLCAALLMNVQFSPTLAMGLLAAACALVTPFSLQGRLSRDRSGQIKEAFSAAQSKALTRYMSRPPHLMLNAAAFLLAAGCILQAPLLPLVTAASLGIPASALRMIRRIRSF